jgi:hypothetical protein
MLKTPSESCRSRPEGALFCTASPETFTPANLRQCAIATPSFRPSPPAEQRVLSKAFGALTLPPAIQLLVMLLAITTSAQNSQFIFDATGNLQAQAAENLAAPQITGQPQMQVVIPGESASFSVGVADTTGVTYQWFFNSSAIPGATADSLLLTDVSSTNEGPYWVAVSNAFGSLGSTLANLYIDSRGCGMPDSWQLQYFGNLFQNPSGDFDGDGVSNLQEFLDGTNPADTNSVLYHLNLSTDGGTVVVSPNQSGYVKGQVVTLTAVDSSGFPFHAWTGDVLTRSNVITLTMSNNWNLVAYFCPIPFEWTSSISGDWNVATNWTPTLIPGSNDSVRIINAVTVTLNTDADVADFTLGNIGSSPTLTGAGALTVHGTCNWVNGVMNGSGLTAIASGATLNIAGAPNGFSVTLGRTLDNAGYAFWTGPAPLNLSGVITNRPGAVFLAANAPYVNFLPGTPRFDNAGTFVTANAGTLRFLNVAFNNYNATQIQAGALALNGGGLNNGTMDVPAGAILSLGAGAFTSSSSSSISGGGTLIVSGGNSTFSGVVNVTGSNIFSSGSAELNGNYVCTNNTLTISGGSVNFDGTGPVSPSVIDLSSGSLGGSDLVTAGNAMIWTGGSMTGSGRTLIPPGATLSINNPSFITLSSRTLDNAGTTTWSGANINISDGVITNEPGALFLMQSPSSIFPGGGSPRFDNAGTLNTPVSGTTIFDVALNNFNTLVIQGGTLVVEGGGLNTGFISVPAGAAISFSGLTFTSSAGSAIAGGGTLMVNSGNVTLSGVVNVTGSNIFANGSAELNGYFVCTNNVLTISGGTVNFDGTGPVSPLVVNLSGGSLGGSNVVTVGNAMSWTGGSMAGTGRTIIPSGATLTINIPSFVTITSRTLENAGVAVWTGAGSINMNGGLITNDVGALFNVQTASSLSIGGGLPRFDNAGIFRKSISAGTFTLASVAFTNYGIVDIQSGVLFANGGGFGSASNAVLNCAIGGTIPATNYGQLQVSGAVNLNGTLSVNLTNNYIPTTADQFTLVTAGTRNGAFSSFIYPSSQLTMVLSNTPTSVIAHATSILAIPQPALFPPQLSGSNIILTWAAVSNATYRVQFNPDLSLSNWTALPGDVTAASNTASRIDPLTSSNRFYRILGLHP